MRARRHHAPLRSRDRGLMMRCHRPSAVLLLTLLTIAAAACGQATTQRSSATPASTVDRVAALKTSFALGTPLPTVPPHQPDTRFAVTDMAFMDSTRGWVLRVSEVATQVLYTSDAGTTWTIQYTGTFTGYRIDFVDALHGWVVGRDLCADSPGSDCSGVMLSTADGGKTWTRSSPAADPLVDVSFIDATNGWVLAVQNCASCQLLLRTRDGGASWQSQPLPSATYVSRPQTLFRFGRSGIIAASRSILVTQDDGATWVKRENGCGARAFLYVAWFLDQSHGWTVCGDGSAGGTVAEKFVYATSDAGMTWQLRSEFLFGASTPPAGVGLAPGQGPSSFVFVNPNDGWMGSEISLFATTDGGRSWQQRSQEPTENFGALQFLNARLGFAQVAHAGFAATQDGGVTWQTRSLP
jgi:photosystem II stability/assembly factor-like uncharacterized protein